MAITPAPPFFSAELRQFDPPRSLKEAVNCRFSNLRNTWAPVMSDKVREATQGVRAADLAGGCSGSNVVELDHVCVLSVRCHTEFFRILEGRTNDQRLPAPRSN